MKLSIVIPVYNEAENLPLLQASIEKSLSALEMDWEVVYIDDGSSDGSQNILEEMASSSPEHVCVVVFRRNCGQTTPWVRSSYSWTPICRMTRLISQ
jgi:glycosyltransferase involved in cell wall biosynthesis